MTEKACFHCGKSLKGENFDIIIEDGPVEVEIVKTRGCFLCPYCFAVLGEDEDDWLPELRLGDIKKKT